MPFECSNIIRRHERSGPVSADQAVQAHADPVEPLIDVWPYEVLAARIWQLRPNPTSCDAAYVALAQTLNVPLVTLDTRIQRAPGVSCVVDTP